MTLIKATVPLAVLLAFSACAGKGDIDTSEGVGITAVRSACPIVGVPAGTGDVTLFDGATGATAAPASTAIDVVATISNVRSTCADAGTDVTTTVTFDVRARRARGDAARDVTLPYFLAITRGGTSVVAKRVGRVGLHFDAGQTLATTNGQATSTVTRAAATLPDNIRQQLTKRRKAGEQDAAIDPLSTPAVRQAVLSATFEALVGFQLTNDQLRYNATR